jgi:hypothetical protein
MIRAVPIGFEERLADPFDLSQNLGAREALMRVLINPLLCKRSSVDVGFAPKRPKCCVAAN